MKYDDVLSNVIVHTSSVTVGPREEGIRRQGASDALVVRDSNSPTDNLCHGV